MNLNKVLDKQYEKMPLKDLPNAPVDAISGVSAGDAELLKKAFNVKTIKDFANLKYVKWAQAIVALQNAEE